MSGVLVIGSTNTDLVCRARRLPVAGETVPGSSFSVYPGGKGANQAVAAARAGARVVYAGAVGDDAFGMERIEDLRREGIDIERLRVVSGVESGVALIVVDDAGENQIVVVPGANGAIDGHQACEAVASVEMAVLSLTLEIPFEAVRAALDGKPQRATSVLNTAPFDVRVRKLIPLTDVLVCNETEASALLERRIELASAEEAARELVELGCRTAIITLGADGAVLCESGEGEHIPALQVDVVDTTAAGDAFCGVVAAWLAQGYSVRNAARAGVVAGALAATRHGAQPSLPYHDAIAARL